jgi:hypothetical protein
MQKKSNQLVNGVSCQGMGKQAKTLHGVRKIPSENYFEANPIRPGI